MVLDTLGQALLALCTCSSSSLSLPPVLRNTIVYDIHFVRFFRDWGVLDIRFRFRFRFRKSRTVHLSSFLPLLFFFLEGAKLGKPCS